MASTILDSTGKPFKIRKSTELPTVRAKYDSAQTSTDNQNHWQWADGLSAAAANSPSVRKKLRERSRYEVANNCYAAGMVRTYANDVVGVGPQLQVYTGDDSVDGAIELAFWKWWQSARIGDKLRMARMSRMVDGEVFLRLVTNPPLDNPVKLDVRVYEGDQIARPYTAVDDPLLSDGIVFDDWGNPVAYTVLDRHPGDVFAFSGNSGSETVPAANMLHLFRVERPGQIRGVPEILAALPLYAQLRRYTLAVIGAAETAADMAALMQTQQAPDDPDDVQPLDVFDLERRSILTLPRGWTVQQMKAEQPATTYEMFKRQIIQEQARCICQPYNVAAGDSGGMNYSSGRLDHMNYARAIRVDRYGMEIGACTPIFTRWWSEAIRIDGVLPEEAKSLPEPPRHEWRWEGSEHQDPAKEATGQQTRLQSHTTTLAREYARLGLDWEDELRQRAKEVSLMRELGLTMDQAAPPASNQAEDDDDAED